MSTVCTVKVLFFAKSRELAGASEAQLATRTPISYPDLLEEVVQRFSLQPIRNSLILAVNEEYSQEDAQLLLKDGDVLAVIPPISGG